MRGLGIAILFAVLWGLGGSSSLAAEETIYDVIHRIELAPEKALQERVKQLKEALSKADKDLKEGKSTLRL